MINLNFDLILSVKVYRVIIYINWNINGTCVDVDEDLLNSCGLLRGRHLFDRHLVRKTRFHGLESRATCGRVPLHERYIREDERQICAKLCHDSVTTIATACSTALTLKVRRVVDFI